MAGKKILMICGDYCEDYETVIPLPALLQWATPCTPCAPTKKAGDHIKTAIHDLKARKPHERKTGQQPALNATFADVKASDQTPWSSPGGRGPQYLRNNAGVLAAVRRFFEANKPVAAVCHSRPSCWPAPAC